MKLFEIIRKHLESGTFSRDDYDWEINHSTLPQGIQVKGNTSFEENVDLKYRLYDAWQNALKAGRNNDLFTLAKYYVSTWGGVRRNSQSTLEKYINEEPSELILDQRAKGVASWSKVLCIRNPDKYPIFDARVSLSLNALQILAPISDADFIKFPDLPSQNRVINDVAPKIRKFLSNKKISKTDNFYQKYISILKSEIFDEYRICELEMLLFSATEKLAYQVLNKI
jgi:hypothetical protein